MKTITTNNKDGMSKVYTKNNTLNTVFDSGNLIDKIIYKPSDITIKGVRGFHTFGFGGNFGDNLYSITNKFNIEEDYYVRCDSWSNLGRYIDTTDCKSFIIKGLLKDCNIGFVCYDNDGNNICSETTALDGTLSCSNSFIFSNTGKLNRFWLSSKINTSLNTSSINFTVSDNVKKVKIILQGLISRVNISTFENLIPYSYSNVADNEQIKIGNNILVIENGEINLVPLE